MAWLGYVVLVDRVANNLYLGDQCITARRTVQSQHGVHGRASIVTQSHVRFILGPGSGRSLATARADLIYGEQDMEHNVDIITLPPRYTGSQ